MLQCPRTNSRIPFHFLPFLPTSWMWRTRDANQGGAKLNCEDHHFVFKGVESKHQENNFNLYSQRSSVCLREGAGMLGDWVQNVMQVGSYVLRRFLWHFSWNVQFCIFLSVHESSASCNCNSSLNHLLGCTSASGTDKYIPSDTQVANYIYQLH